MPVQLNGADLITSFGDYEEGIFTVTAGDFSLDGVGECQTYSDQDGRYIKIGNRVFFDINMTCTSMGNCTTSEQLIILGLPFTSNSGIQASIVVGHINSINVTAGFNVSARQPGGTAYLDTELADAAGGVTDFLISEATDAFDIFLSGSYTI